MKHSFTLLLVASFFFCSLAGLSGQNFRVQIAAYTEKMPDTFFREKGVAEVVVTHDQMGMYRYFAGSYATLEEAEKVQKELIGKGFPYASVIDLEVQRVLSASNCPYARDGVPPPMTPQQAANVRNIYFDFGSSDLDAEAKQELDKICQKLKENPTSKLQIQGHTDGIGDKEANMELAGTRARAARNYLINKGIRADRMYLKVFGESAPVADNSEESIDGKKGEDLPENRKWNRRVTLSFMDEQVEVKTDGTMGGG